MRLSNLKFKSVWVVLLFVILLQSCAVYEKAPVSLDQAATANCKIIIIRSDDTKLHLKKIEKIDGSYYGITYYKDNKVKVPITESDIKSIRVLNKSATTWSNIGIAGALVITVFIVVLIATGWFESNSGNGSLPPLDF